MFRRAVRAVAGYVPGEQPRDRRTIKLNTNENPYPPSPKVLEAVQAAASADLRLYPQPMADDLRERAARAYGLRPENVLAGNGSDELLTLIVRAVVEPAARVAFPVPGYSLYQTLVDLEDGDVHAVPFPEDFSLPDALVSSPAKLVLLANPNSPSGTLIPPAEIRRLLERKNRLVVVDEAYVDFAETSCLELLSEHPNLVVLRTFSKSFSLAGMRVGLALAAEPVIATLAKIKDSYNVGRLALVAAEVALREMRWMEANVRKIRRTREQLSESLTELGFRVYPSQANFVMARWPDRDLGPVQQTLRRRGILVRHFATPDLRDSLRITVGTDAEIATFLRVLKRILEEPAR